MAITVKIEQGVFSGEERKVARLIVQLVNKEPGRLSPADYLAVIAQENAHFAVARNGLEMVGFAFLFVSKTILSPKTGSGFLTDLVVDESCRRQGVGEKLLALLMQKVRELGLVSVETSVHHNREHVLKMLERQGFKLCQAHVCRWRADRKRKRLTPPCEPFSFFDKQFKKDILSHRKEGPCLPI